MERILSDDPLEEIESQPLSESHFSQFNLSLSGLLWPDLAGRLMDNGGHVMPIRIYYENTDHSGIVYHADYVQFLERGRSDYLRLLGIHHTDLAQGVYGKPIYFAVRRLSVDYQKSAKLDDVLIVETRPVLLRGVRLHLQQIIWKDDLILVKADVTVVMIDGLGRPQRPPKALVAIFERLNGHI